jgi:Phosphotransferase enzyme family
MEMDLPFVAERAPLEPALAAAAVAARRWGLREPEVLRHGMNLICAAGDDVVLRVSTPTVPAEQGWWLGEFLTSAGIRVPKPMRPDVVRHNGCSVVAVERIHGHGDIDWTEVGAMVARLHSLDVAGVDGRYPTPWCGMFPWWSLRALAAQVDDLLDDAARIGIHRTLANLDDWEPAARAAPPVLCHGDVHPGNVLTGVHGPVLLDWDLLCVAPPAWDHAALLTWTERWGGEPGVYEAFADGYGWSGRGDPLAERLALGRLLAATLMRLRAGRSDEAAATEAQRRLAYWRGDVDAAPWTAQ